MYLKRDFYRTITFLVVRFPSAVVMLRNNTPSGKDVKVSCPLEGTDS